MLRFLWNCRKRTALHKWLTQGPERKRHSQLYLLQFQPIFLRGMKHVGSLRVLVEIASWLVTRRIGNCLVLQLCNQEIFPFDLIINDMKRIFKKVFKSKKPSLGSIHGPEPATLTSTPMRSTTDLMPFIPTGDVIADTQATAGVSVSVQLRSSHL